MTIEEVMELVYKRLKARMYEWDVSEVLEADEAIKSAIAALVAQARNEEAEACASVVHSAMTCVMTCDASGHPATEYINRAQTVADIRVRIAARARKATAVTAQQREGSMSDDRKLLELAAKAVGLKLRYNYLGERDADQPWDPLEDDGDALRLAVKVGIVVRHYPFDRVVYANDEELLYDNSKFGGDCDPYAATRRAIVRAAAAIAQEGK